MREAKSPKTIPRFPVSDPFTEWVAACEGGPRPGSSFEYGASLTELLLLGNVALRAPGKRLRWDAANLRLPDTPELERHLRAEPRVF